MKIAIGSDHGGFSLKEKLIVFLKKKGYDIVDFGAYNKESCDYPLISFEVAKKVAKRKCNKGILICRSGIGNAITANKIKGIRAAVCYNVRQAKLSRKHNDANIIVLGADFTSVDNAKKIISAWLKEGFLKGRHLRRVNQIRNIEKKAFK